MFSETSSRITAASRWFLLILKWQWMRMQISWHFNEMLFLFPLIVAVWLPILSQTSLTSLSTSQNYCHLLCLLRCRCSLRFPLSCQLIALCCFQIVMLHRLSQILCKEIWIPSTELNSRFTKLTVKVSYTHEHGLVTFIIVLYLIVAMGSHASLGVNSMCDWQALWTHTFSLQRFGWTYSIATEARRLAQL